VAITAEDYQATALTRPRPEAGQTERPASEPDRDRIGIVFVHGIGTQKPSETFLDWSKPIVQILTTWRVDHGFSPDPVVKAEFSFSGSAPPYLELEVPAIDGHPRRHWVVTEAWWAARLRPPSLSDAAAYVRHGLPQILRRIRESAGAGRSALDTRHAEEEDKVQRQAGAGDFLARELQNRTRWSWIDLLDRVQRWLTVLAYIPALLLGTALLLLYAPLRLIPVKAIQNAAILRSADSFLTDWFGDLPDVLEDPVQAANVRARIAESIAGLREQLGCGSIVVVAHSGGAIMSFTTLLDPAYEEQRVHRLLTIGEALALAWRLHRTGTPDAKPEADRLTGDLVSFRKDLNWTDFWASYDPAPAGPIVAPAGVTIKVESRPVTNRMSVLEDHGSYWENEEGFIVPLVRYLDEARGDPHRSRFFPDGLSRLARIERRRQRVGVLALWRWIAVLGAAIPIVASTIARAVAGGAIPGPAGIGAGIAAKFGDAPFHQLITVPLDLVASLATFPAWFVQFGEWLVGAGVIVAIFLLIAIIGLRIWAAWDAREREIARHEELQPVHRWDVALVSVLAVLVTVFVSAAAWKAAFGLG
jgi:hypothetical protein